MRRQTDAAHGVRLPYAIGKSSSIRTPGAPDCAWRELQLPTATSFSETLSMSTRVLVLRAGSGMAHNVIRSLRAGDAAIEIVGCHDDRFVLAKSTADRNYALAAAPEQFLSSLCRIIERERIDLLIPVNDRDVHLVSSLRKSLPCRTFLPTHAVIEQCQDKFNLTTFLRKHGIPAPLTYAISRPDRADAVFRRFGKRELLWCRIRAGTGSFGAIPVKNAEQVRSWISYWEEMRGLTKGAFTLSEYLPGRDYYVQSLWKNGKLVLTKMAERLQYLDNGSPSGVSSLSSLAKTACEPHVMEICARAVRALDPRANGVFFTDLKERADGTPCITEINAGRFTIGTNLLDLAGAHNMVAIFVQLALGKRVTLREATDYAANFYAVRAIDTATTVVSSAELCKDLLDCRSQSTTEDRHGRERNGKPAHSDGGHRKAWHAWH